ncbi:MAG: hypothetical protein A3C02_02780 [Candidatus Andersenbacteria bacterium RIFCSPHIGHO2_02_FULL_45_11]|uniref:Uncharacterized protein n=1 Tax=Candidatus Andersenbacteria bacterium RIFCSPHIGHO2_12_FULL_45_11 TaxID=1797281 RepID=A0A1G1X5I4_9BACT|nr:MAG: hypothetical protein A2805_03050 [Candidatus Andersenbacteria bacterium RIFCSPHIGHO2_01_FULL_46_36]OGY33622.1 MAG: hypothetical protein A3C02_02780 [Candidatus Andersenbacteria bacterium RIFCSPHIGHO2_02_FULL_45_11]OGY35292.1 MAG: hypothetical protein A3D99_04330 [Candidatus Andersenbacteria bacterium RIFCSPHIGHO2_12_FULL_45_11]
MSEDVYNKLIADGFERIERDDRMLDVFPNETREKGVELWDKWTKDEVEIIRFHLPSGEKRTTSYVLSRKEVEKALVNNTQIQL